MEYNLKKMKMEDNLNNFFKLEWQTQKRNEMEDDLKIKLKNEGRPPKEMEDDLKINLIGCDTIVNSPSFTFWPSSILTIKSHYH
jgi:hypothetical protein